MHGFLSLLLHCGFLRLTGDLKASSLVNHVVECRRKRPFFSPEWRFGEASECGLEAWKDFYFKLFFSFEKLSESKKKNFRTLKITSWFCQGLRRRGAGNFKQISSNQSE